MSDLERVALERDDARELHREVVRHLVAQIAELTRERDRALACEAAALALLAEWRERVASPPSPTSANGPCECPPDFQRYSSIPGAHTPSCPAVRAPPEAERCGECGGEGVVFRSVESQPACPKCGGCGRVP